MLMPAARGNRARQGKAFSTVAAPAANFRSARARAPESPRRPR